MLDFEKSALIVDNNEFNIKTLQLILENSNIRP